MSGSLACVVCGNGPYGEFELVGGLTSCEHCFHSICALVTIKRMQAGHDNVTCRFQGCVAQVCVPEIPVLDAIAQGAVKEFAHLETNNLVNDMSYDTFINNLTESGNASDDSESMSGDRMNTLEMQAQADAQIITIGAFHDDAEMITARLMTRMDLNDRRGEMAITDAIEIVSESLASIELRRRKQIHWLRHISAQLDNLNQRSLVNSDANKRRLREIRLRNDALRADMRRNGIEF
jgi:hypothetical protein